MVQPGQVSNLVASTHMELLGLTCAVFSFFMLSHSAAPGIHAASAPVQRFDSMKLQGSASLFFSENHFTL